MRKILLLFFLIPLCSIAQSSDSLIYNQVRDLSDDWLVFDKYYQSYVPFIEQKHKRLLSVSSRIDVIAYNGYKLKFTAAPELSLFINQKLYFKNLTHRQEEVIIDIKKIASKDDNKGEALLTFYHPQGMLPLKEARIVNASTNITGIKEIGKNKEAVFPRIIDTSLGGYMLIFLSLVLSYILFRNAYPREFIPFFSLLSGANKNIHDEYLMTNPVSVPSLWVIFMNALAIYLITELLHVDIGGTMVGNKLLYITLVIMFLYILKYAYIFIIAWLFNYTKIVKLQYIEQIKFITKVLLVVLPLTMIISSSGYYKFNVSSEGFYLLSIFIAIIALLRIILLFFRGISFRNLYLFSYLCVAEILPLVIAVKILLY
jgi:hypothetical protein